MTLWAAEKDAGGGVLKSAQDFFENTVYSIGLRYKTDAGSFKKDAKCEHSLRLHLFAKNAVKAVIF